MHGSGRNDSIAGTQPDLDDVSISSDPHHHWSAPWQQPTDNSAGADDSATGTLRVLAT